MNREVRSAVIARCSGVCEVAGCGQWHGTALHADHFFGRGKSTESVETVWALCPRHDHEKTLNWPTAAHWLEEFILHCGRHGYDTTRAENRLVFVNARKAMR